MVQIGGAIVFVGMLAAAVAMELGGKSAPILWVLVTLWALFGPWFKD